MSSLSIRLSRLASCAVLVAVTALSGCALFGHTLVNYDLGLEVSSVDTQGEARPVSSSQVSYRSAGRDSKFGEFSDVIYSGVAFSWQPFLTREGVGGDLKGLIEGEVCMRLDQARISSNFDTTPKPAHATAQQSGLPTLENIKANKRTTAAKAFQPQKQCFGQARSGFFFLAIDLRDLYPSGNMLDVVWRGESLIRDGKGNWFRLQVPVEFQGKREDMTFTFTAKQIRLSTAYW
jgi:hypothetical protein